MGRNGAGKSTLLKSLVGHERRPGGGAASAARSPSTLRRPVEHVGLVPQKPADLLYASTVADECDQADADAGARPGPRDG